MLLCIVSLSLLGCPASANEIDLTGLGALDYTKTVYADLIENTTVDARGTSWIVSNSPVGDADASEADQCDDGSGESRTNPYPIRVYRSPMVTVEGALITGEVSQTLSWGAAYCNSAAVAIFDSPEATVENVRVDAGWDAVRHAEREGSADGHRTKHLWVTRNRDDCIEADAMNNALFEDILCESFVGISAANKKVSNPENTMTLSGVIISLLEYEYDGTLQSGSPIKLNSDSAIGLKILDSVIMLNSSDMVGGQRQFPRIRASIRECDNNLLIWPFDTEPPEFVDLPDCFTVLTGADAGTSRWRKIRRNWIDCHPDVPRLRTDPDSQPENCDRTEYGGMYS